MYCKKCGSAIKEGNLFCTNCGTGINENVNNNKKPLTIKLNTAIVFIILIILLSSVIVFIIVKSKSKNIMQNSTANEETNTIYDESSNSKIEETYTDNSNNNEDYQDNNNLLEQIYLKYPELKDKEGIICSNYDNEYWLLDEKGKKMYFTDIDEFEALLSDCPSVQQILNKQNNTNTQTNQNNNVNTDNVDNNTQEYVNIPKIVGLTEQQAVEQIKKLNIPYEILYREDLNQAEGIVLEQSYHYDVITNINGDIVGGYKKSILYPRRNFTYLY